MGRRGKVLNWEAGKGRGKWGVGGGARGAPTCAVTLPAFLLHGARAEARLGGNAKRACGASGVGGCNEWVPGSGRSTRN